MCMYGGRKDPQKLEHYKHFKNTTQFVNVVYYIDCFVDIEESLHPWDKDTEI